MRGRPKKQVTMLSLDTPEKRVPKDHPLRKIKPFVDEILSGLSSVFDKM